MFVKNEAKIAGKTGRLYCRATATNQHCRHWFRRTSTHEFNYHVFRCTVVQWKSCLKIYGNNWADVYKLANVVVILL